MSHKTWFRLDVTQADIDGGVCRNPEMCVLARAINRTLNKDDPQEIATVDYDSVDLWFQDCVPSLYFHDHSAFNDYLHEFDNSRKVTPTTFIVYAVDLPARVVEILRDKGLLLDGEPK